MSQVVTTNKHGQSLGRKGHETRERLMLSARKLLRSTSPVELSAMAIARKVKLSSATFYIYFDDVRDLLLSLSEDAEREMAAVHAVLDEPWDPLRVDVEHARRVVRAHAEVWNKHREVLRFRNLEADRGDRAFENIRLRTSLRIAKRFAAHIFAARGPAEGLTEREARAEAYVLVAAMERTASLDPEVMGRTVGAEAMGDALTRMIVRTLRPAPSTRGGR